MGGLGNGQLNPPIVKYSTITNELQQDSQFKENLVESPISSVRFK